MIEHAALRGRGLRKTFAPKGKAAAVVALDGIDVEIAAGSLSCIVGPDGAGKTTLLRLAAGLLTVEAGELSVLGLDAKTQAQEIQNRISYMPQRFGLYEDLSVQENLDLYADLHGVPHERRRERYARLMQMTDLGRFTQRPAGKLSGGMKQKLGLACTLVRSPALLLLDEPTVGVDPLSRRDLWQIVHELVDKDKLTVVVTTAYMDEAQAGDRVVVLRLGKVIAAGTPAEIRSHADDLAYVARPAGGETARALQARLLDAAGVIIDAVPQGGEVRLVRRAEASQQALRELAPSAEAVEPRLEDGFMVLLRGGESGRGEATARLQPAAGHSSGRAARQSAGDTVIEVRDLVMRFGDFTAVANTTFSVKRGEVFGLLGPNGAGKTTTFRVLCGLLPATSGYLRVAGVDLRRARSRARQRIGYVSQKFALYGNLTVAENLNFFGGAYGLHGDRLKQRRERVLGDFDLQGQHQRASAELPGGYKQRLQMAAALLHEPDILFLDEPTSGADPLARRDFWRRITALAQAGVTVVVTTHFMEEAEYCDRVVIMDAGKVLALGTPQEVREQAGEAGARAPMEEAFIAIVEKSRSQEARS